MAWHVALAWTVVGRCCLCGSIKIWNLVPKLDIQPVKRREPVLKKDWMDEKWIRERKIYHCVVSICRFFQAIFSNTIDNTLNNFMSGNNQDGKGKVEKPLLMLKHICPWIQMDKVPDLGFQLEKATSFENTIRGLYLSNTSVIQSAARACID